MNKTHTSLLAAALLVAIVGCKQPEPTAPADTPAESSETPAEAPSASSEVVIEAPAEAPAAEEQFSEAGSQTDLAPIALEPFTVDALHIGDVSKGHFNLYVRGGEPAVVRAWVGDEKATNVVVTKAEFEVDHHCAHIEVPQPLPADAALWVEIETADGTRLKGNTKLQ